MWLQLCIKNTCTSHIRTRASPTRYSSHCLLSVSKLFVSGITSEQTRFASNFLHHPLKECNIYVSINLRTVWAIGWFYIEHTFSKHYHLLLHWSFYSLQNAPFVKRLHIVPVDIQDYYLQLLSATPRPKSISHPTIRHLSPTTRQFTEILTISTWLDSHTAAYYRQQQASCSLRHYVQTYNNWYICTSPYQNIMMSKDLL